MKISIKWLLIAGVIGLLVISVSIILASSYLTSQKVLLRHAKHIMENIATFTIHEAQNYLNPAGDAARLTQRLARNAVVSSQDTDALEQYLYEQLNLHSNFAGMFLGLPSGAFFYVSRSNTKVDRGFRTKIIRIDNGVKTTELIWRDAKHAEISREFDPDDDYDPRKRPWYIKAESDRDTIWTDPYIFFTSRKPGVTAASPQFQANGDLAGVVGVDIEIAQISTFLSQLKVGKNGRAFIMNQHGAVVAFPDLSKITLPNQNKPGAFRLTHINELDDVLSRKAFAALQRPSDRLNIAQPLFGSFRHDAQRYHTMFTPFADPQWPWIIGIYLPENDYLGPIKRNRLLNIYIMLGIATVGSLVGWAIVRSIVRPMTAFQLEAQAIKDYDLDSTYNKDSVIKEIQDTADSFAQMKTGLQSFKQQNTILTQDLHERAEELRRKETGLRSTFTSLVNFSDALIVLHHNHTMQFLNPAAESLLQVQTADILGTLFPYPVVQHTPTEIEIETDGRALVIAEMRVVNTEWEGQPALLVSLRDITERKQLEIEQQRLLAEAERLYTQAEDDATTKTILLKEVNHRVKNNLSAIIGMLYAEKRHGDTNHEPRYQDAVQELINRIQGLATVHSLLSQSEWSPLVLRDLTQEIIHGALQGLPAHKQVSVNISPSPIRVTPVQASNLAMVINEIATNTAKYALQHQDHCHMAVTITPHPDSPAIDLELRDDGPGYPEDVLSLERFSTGIYLIQNIVHNDLRGTLQLRNDPGAVTTIQFDLTTQGKAL